MGGGASKRQIKTDDERAHDRPLGKKSGAAKTRRDIQNLERKIISEEQTRADEEVGEEEVTGADFSPAIDDEVRRRPQPGQRAWHPKPDRHVFLQIRFETGVVLKQADKISADERVELQEKQRRKAAAWMEKALPPAGFVQQPNIEFAPDEQVHFVALHKSSS